MKTDSVLFDPGASSGTVQAALDKERVAFEAWALGRSFDIELIKDGWGRPAYRHSHIDAMWKGWQAGADEAKGRVDAYLRKRDGGTVQAATSGGAR